MSSSNAIHTLLDIRNKLEKYLAAEDNVENHESSILDMLKVVQNTNVKPDTITQSGLGNVISSIRKKFSAHSTAIAELCHAILLHWKNILKQVKEEKQVAGVVKRVDADSAGLEQLRLLKQQNQDRLLSLSKTRMATFNMFRNLLKEMDNINAEKLALDIEEGLNNKYPHESSSKPYMAKARSLAFNISKNQELREQISTNGITVERLLSLSTTELASAQIKSEREKVSGEAVESRRLDWLEEHKEEIQHSLGLDPNNKWDYDSDDGSQSEPDIDPPDI